MLDQANIIILNMLVGTNNASSSRLLSSSGVELYMEVGGKRSPYIYALGDLDNGKRTSQSITYMSKIE